MSPSSRSLACQNEGVPALSSASPRRWWRWAVPLAVTTVALGVVEAYLRYDQTPANARFRIPDEQRGWVLRPGDRGWAADEAKVWVEINSAGLRDRERSLKKPARTRRVVVLGDSYIEAFNVPLEKTFTAYLEAHLNRCGRDRDWQAEVLNFGVGGYGTAQELLTYRLHARHYEPDVVLLAVYTSNDVANNHPRLNPASSRHLSPYFVLRDDELILVPPSAAAIADAWRSLSSLADPALPWYQRTRLWLTERSLIAEHLYLAYAARINPPPPEAADPEDEPAAEEEDGEDVIYHEPTKPMMTEAWAVTEALILAAAREATADGAEFWMATLSNAEQVHPDPAVRAEEARSRGVADLLYPDRRLRAFASRHGIPFVMLVEPLAAYAVEHGVFLNGGYRDYAPPGSGHWNETANALAAEIVGARLCAESRAMAPTAPAGAPAP